MPPAEPQDQLPEQIGRYRIVRLLGQGAMGRVLLAHDPVLDRDVAVKLLRDDLAIAPDQRLALIERMRQEARASARVGHPGIVALHDMGEDTTLGLYLVFEYVEGLTLKDKLARGALGPEAAAKIAREIGDALTTAHSAGVLHRDIKPENIILARTGAKVADFGIARVPDSTLTRDGGLLGTPAYSAPESISSGKFSPLSDQFSFAATMWEGISGRRAFPGDDAVAVASHIATDEPPEIAAVCGLDPHVDTVLARALSKNPKSRFSTCEEFGRALAEALELSSARLAMPTLPDEYHRESWKQETQTHTTRIALGGAAVGALVAIAALQITAHLRPGAKAIASAAPQHAPKDEHPVAWLAERPPPHHSHRHSKHAKHSHTSDAADASAPADAGTDALVDAGGSAPDGNPSTVATAPTENGRDAGTKARRSKKSDTKTPSR